MGERQQRDRTEEKRLPKAEDQATEKGWREKLPGMLAGPINALFPHVPPSPLYPADQPPPAFLRAAASRTAWRSRKHLLRAMLVLLATFILVLNPDSLTVLGQASFFGMIVSVMLPPTFPAQVFLMVATMLVFGMCLGWAWGCAAMAAGLRARDRVLLASSLQRVQTGIAGATNPDAEYRTAIFRGEFLDWRACLVHGFFLWIGLFVLGLLRAKSPKLMLVALFASIVLDVMCSYGPLFPFAQYTLATTFLLPTACFIAIAVASNLLIFPESLNYSWTIDLVDKILAPVLERSQLHSKILATPPPPFHAINEEPALSSSSSSSSASAAASSPWSPFTPVFASTQEALSTGLEGLLGSIPMLELDISFGRLSSKDLAGLVEPLRELHVRSVGLGVLFNTVESRYKRYQSLQPSTSSSSPSSALTKKSLATSKPSPTFAETARMRQARSRLTHAELANGHDLASLLPILDTASASVREAGDRALESSMRWLVQQNAARWDGLFPTRWKTSPDADPRNEERDREQIAALEAELKTYRSEGRQAIVEPFRDFFDPKTGKLRVQHPRDAPSSTKDSPTFAPGSLFTLLSASDNLVVYLEAVLAFVKRVDDLRAKRTRNKLWFPTGVRKIGKLLKGGKGTNKVMGDGENPDTVEEVGDESDDESTLADAESGAVEKEKKGKKGKTGKKPQGDGEKLNEKGLDPDARPPKNALQRFTFGLYRFLHFFTTPEGLFALKYASFSIAIWLPQQFESTAYLCYSEKSLWALITFQTFLGLYSGDQILSSIQKVLGAAIGLVYGMLLWYLGAANGPGSPYGLGAAVFVFMIPAMAIRIYAPLASSQVAIQAAVTTILVVGYSWQDTHIPSVGNPGVGYTLAWKRALLIVIGTGVGFIAMFLPPQSSRVLVRRTHATCIHELGRVYTFIISAWLREELEPNSSSSMVAEEAEGGGFSPTARKAARARMLALRVKLNTTRVAIVQAPYEVSLRGDWPKEEYHALLSLQLQLLQALAQLGQALVRLDPEWRKALVHETAFLNQALIADVTSTFSLLSLALRQGSPLPQATPGPLLDRLLYHDHRLRLLSSPADSSPSNPDSQLYSLSSSSSAGNSLSAASPADEPSVEGARVSSSPLTFALLASEEFGIYSSALQALASILLDLDEAERAVKRLCGEVWFPGYERLERV
ncbi:hypothetical protein JCM8097_007230 [Rhodosporidiobolus ruineniae]